MVGKVQILLSVLLKLAKREPGYSLYAMAGYLNCNFFKQRRGYPSWISVMIEMEAGYL